MHGQRLIFLLTYMVIFAISVSLAFNFDTTNPEVYNGEQEDFFGYKVHQYQSEKGKGIIATAPLQLNGTGGICKVQQFNITCVNPTESVVGNTNVTVKHFGLSLAANPTSSQFIVCSPSLVHECHKNSYLNSVCYKITDELKKISTMTSGFQECTKKTVNLVFLFDGSESMTTAEFTKNKDFIVDIMSHLKNTSIKFAAVQFSTTFKTVFDFKDYEANTALSKLKSELHMKGLTNTHRALRHVLENVLCGECAGASRDATKVLVLITDGDPSDKDKKNIIGEYEKSKVMRFVIGVKMKTLDKVKPIASEPKDKNAFKIDDYNGLTGILDNFQNRIFTMEGSTVTRAGEMTNEMSQSGFSAVAYKNTLILGAVGSNSWRGSLQERQHETEKTIQDSDLEEDSYMGYSVAVGEKNSATLYFTGAPRFKYIGQVLVCKDNGTHWNVNQRIDGEKMGSYFGAELCSVDINSDGDTDFLVVGAPLLYHTEEKREGQIYIYALTDKMELESKMNVTVPSMGRFGTTISSIADINGDHLRDLAVGAPLEDENRGAVYIYLGDSQQAIRSTYSQRITGQDLKLRLSFFGQAIDGNIDLGNDGLPDIVVGSRGAAVVLRSRPVFNVKAHLSFHPKEISTEEIDCVTAKNEILPLVTLTVCFEMVEVTKSIDGLGYGLNISYMLDVDPTRERYRGFFSDTDSKARNLTNTYELTDNETCMNHSVSMKKCVRDTLAPISLKLNFSQVDTEIANAVLNMDIERQTAVEVPFQKECRKNDTCIAELEVDLKFETETLLVAQDNRFHVFITLKNEGDDSYNTSLVMHYPEGLSFSLLTLTTATRPTSHFCPELNGVKDKTLCSISLPVYRSRTEAKYNASFRIEADPKQFDWNDTISMTVIAHSDNMKDNQNISVTKSLPVKFEINMATTVPHDSINYLNFTPEYEAPKKLVNTYTINNLGLRMFPVNVTFLFPTQLEHTFEMKNYKVSVQENKTECTSSIDKNSSEYPPHEHWKMIVCDTLILDSHSEIEFELSGDVQFRDLKKIAGDIGFIGQFFQHKGKVDFKSYLNVSYDHYQYVLHFDRQKDSGATLHSDDPREKSTKVRVEFLIAANEPLITATGVGVGLLFLIIITVVLYKLGCFNRKRMADMVKKILQSLDGCLRKNSAELFANTPDESSTMDDVVQAEANLAYTNQDEGDKLLGDIKIPKGWLKGICQYLMERCCECNVKPNPDYVTKDCQNAVIKQWKEYLKCRLSCNSLPDDPNDISERWLKEVCQDLVNMWCKNFKTSNECKEMNTSQQQDDMKDDMKNKADIETNDMDELLPDPNKENGETAALVDITPGALHFNMDF